MRSAKLFRILTVLLVGLGALVMPHPSAAQVAVGISVGFAPPALPVYEQPICPGDGYIWTPGYWAWDPDIDDYYWVPGTWVLAPEPGFLWTPGWWGWGGSAFIFHAGYWGPTVGFYGGINYGFGYFGHGFVGGRWEGGHFFYNHEVANINVREIHNVYTERVENVNVTHVSYNGGSGGINARATAQEEAAARERHIGPVAAQTEHVNIARGNQELRASVNHGKPAIAATERPGTFKGSGVVAARSGEEYHPPANRGGSNGANRPPAAREENNPNRPPNASREENSSNRATYVHPNDLPKANRPAPPSTGNAKTDQRYQQQQEKLYSRQEQERQKLQQRQDQEHQRASKQGSSPAKQQQMEQRHQQQTQQLQQKHEQQQQHLQQRQAPPPKKH